VAKPYGRKENAERRENINTIENIAISKAQSKEDGRILNVSADSSAGENAKASEQRMKKQQRSRIKQAKNSK
jgi:hypothetical protein